MVGMTRKDYEFFWKLSSANHALASSACDSVVMPSDFANSLPRGLPIPEMVARQFYDTLEDENGAMNGMITRVENYFNDVSRHQMLHHFMAKFFDDIKFGLGSLLDKNPPNRDYISSSALNLIGHMKQQTDLIKSHHEIAGPGAFLYYPRCFPGHYFAVSGTKFIVENSFNPSGSQEGFLAEIAKLDDLRVEFVHRKDKLPNVRNIFDDTYANNVKTEFLLWDRAVGEYRKR